MDLQKIPGSQLVITMFAIAAAASSAVIDAIANALDEIARLLHPCPPEATARSVDPMPRPMTVPEEQSFRFRRSWDSETGAVARNVEQFEQELKASSPDVVAHHSLTGDFSRWVSDVLGNRPLADALAVVEADVRTGASDPTTGRERLLSALRTRASA
jgi:hypothetical protein